MPPAAPTPPNTSILNPGGQAAAPAAQAVAQAQQAGGLALNLNIIAFIGVALFVIAVIVLIQVARKWRVIAPAAPYKQLENAMKANADAVGFIIDAGSWRGRFFPLYRLGSIYYYDVGKDRRVFTPTYDKPIVLGGKPLYIGIEFNRSSIEVEPARLAAFGLVEAVLPEEQRLVFSQAFDSKRGILPLLKLLETRELRKRGVLRQLGGITFEVNLDDFILSYLNTMTQKANAIMTSQSGLWQSIESSSKTLSGRLGWLAQPNVGMNIVMIVIGIAGAVIMFMMIRGLGLF